jgi:serine/threonine protein kinase
MSLRHPHIVTFIGTCLEKKDFYIVTEYLEKKSLKNVIENKKNKLSTLEKLKICQDVAISILYLHSRKPQVFHRDLKSSNCLVDANMRVKICDFGLSKIYEELKLKKEDSKGSSLNLVSADFYQTNCTGTSFWMAPEFITDNLFTDRADIYAFGILIWEVMMRDPVPYKNISEIAFLCGDKEILKLRPEIPQNFDPEIRELMQSCWDHDYTQRPNIITVVSKLEILINKFNSEKSD